MPSYMVNDSARRVRSHRRSEGASRGKVLHGFNCGILGVLRKEPRKIELHLLDGRDDAWPAMEGFGG